MAADATITVQMTRFEEKKWMIYWKIHEHVLGVTNMADYVCELRVGRERKAEFLNCAPTLADRKWGELMDAPGWRVTDVEVDVVTVSIGTRHNIDLPRRRGTFAEHDVIENMVHDIQWKRQNPGSRTAFVAGPGAASSPVKKPTRPGRRVVAGGADDWSDIEEESTANKRSQAEKARESTTGNDTQGDKGRESMAIKEAQAEKESENSEVVETSRKAPRGRTVEATRPKPGHRVDEVMLSSDGEEGEDGSDVQEKDTVAESSPRKRRSSSQEFVEDSDEDSPVKRSKVARRRKGYGSAATKRTVRSKSKSKTPEPKEKPAKTARAAATAKPATTVATKKCPVISRATRTQKRGVVPGGADDWSD